MTRQNRNAEPKNRYSFHQDEKQLANSYNARLPTRKPWVMKGMLARHQNAIKRAKAEADEFLWEIDGTKYNRYKMMEFLVILVGEGIALAEICEDDRFPSLAEVRGWEKNHPQFVEDMRLAEAVRGEILIERALKVTTDLDEKEKLDSNDVKKASLQHEALTKHAAYFNKKYTPKAVQQVEDITPHLNEEQARQRLMAIIRDNPAIGDAVIKAMPTLANTINEITDAVVLENPGDVKHEVETHSQEGV